jgi:aprataxin
MIILVGLPGAGKSTFATSLIQQSPERFARVNQDSVKNGKRGTRDMCINTATSALRQGINVIIDRTNVTPEQRKYFLDTATTAGLDPSHVHCVFLNLPAKACGSRAADRQDHEGGVFGPKAYATVGMMQKQLVPPLTSEGFASILECQNDAEIDAALALWVEYTTQINNGEKNLLNLNDEWDRMQPRKKEGGKNNSNGNGGGGLQKLDKFFNKNTISDSAPDVTEGGSTFAATRPSSKDGNAFSVMMKASKQQQSPFPPSARKPARRTKPTATRHKFGFAPVLNTFQRYLHNPEQLLVNSNNNNNINNNSTTAATTASASGDDLPVLYCDSECIIVPDKYPKSRYHILVLARDPKLQGPLDLTSDDVALVQHMKDVGLKWAREHAAASGGVKERLSIGFHSVPSMRQLHLHVLTTDYDSVCLKRKQHWNSFTTDFFLDVDWVIAQLESLSHTSSSQNQRYLEYDVAEKEALIKGPMRCPKCSAMLEGMPEVKAHVALCIGKLS